MHHDELDTSAELVEIIRKIIEGGKRNGRKQDIIRKEVSALAWTRRKHEELFNPFGTRCVF